MHEALCIFARADVNLMHGYAGIGVTAQTHSGDVSHGDRTEDESCAVQGTVWS